MRLLTFSQLISTAWPGIDLAEEFGEGMCKGVHFYTRLPAPRCELLYITTPSTAASIQAETRRRRVGMDNVLFFVTPIRSLTKALLENAVNAAYPFQVVIDPDTLVPDLRLECFSNVKQAVWMDDSKPPEGWAGQMLSELGGSE